MGCKGVLWGPRDPLSQQPCNADPAQEVSLRVVRLLGADTKVIPTPPCTYLYGESRMKYTERRLNDFLSPRAIGLLGAGSAVQREEDGVHAALGREGLAQLGEHARADLLVEGGGDGRRRA